MTLHLHNLCADGPFFFFCLVVLYALSMAGILFLVVIGVLRALKKQKTKKLALFFFLCV